MKKCCRALFLLPFVAGKGIAGDFITEPVATAYLSVPLFASRRGNEQPLFGLRLDQVERDNTGNRLTSLYSPSRPPLVNFSFNHKGVEGVYVNGVNTVTPTILKAGASDSSVWWIVGGSAVAAGIALSLSGGRVATSPTPASAPEPPRHPHQLMLCKQRFASLQY